MRLQEKAIIVTGSARGIGKAYAIALAKEGASIVVSDILKEGIDQTVDEIQKSGGKAIGIRADVSSEIDSKRIAEECAKEFGKIDVLINNAALFGGLKQKSFAEIDVEEWDRVLAVNLRGSWLCTKAVFPYMKMQGKGKIINIASGTFFSGSRYLSHYVSSKAALIGLARSLSAELGQYNITINCLAPGYTITEGSTSVNPNREHQIANAQRRALKRDEYPEDLAGTMIYLCSSESDFVTGQTILVNGGGSFH